MKGWGGSSVSWRRGSRAAALSLSVFPRVWDLRREGQLIQVSKEEQVSLVQGGSLLYSDERLML